MNRPISELECLFIHVSSPTGKSPNPSQTHCRPELASYHTSWSSLNRLVLLFFVVMVVISKCNWLPTKIDDATLEKFVKSGHLDSKEVIGWRTAPGELIPNPADGEVVIFTDYLERGFKPRRSKFFRDVLHFLNVHPQDLGPNSISNLC